jgi:hypothetical protein
MKKSLRHLITSAVATAALFAASSGPTWANTNTYLGNLIGQQANLFDSFGSLQTGTTFSDNFTFDILPTGSFASIVTTIDLSSIFSISGFTMTLSGGTLGAPVVGTSAGGPQTLLIGPVSLGAGAVASGTGYLLNIAGTVAGSAGGSYSGLAVATVPEPSSYALMLAGLGLIGVTVRRRSRASSSKNGRA